MNTKFLGLLLLSSILSVSAYSQTREHIIYQISCGAALDSGCFSGPTTLGELKTHGDFGLGTINGLDGELVGTGGEFYQVKSDGIAYPALEVQQIPYAVVTFFHSDKTLMLNATMNYQQLQTCLDNLLPTKNIFYAIKIEGQFKKVKTRSVFKQTEPYPRLSEALRKQAVVEIQNVEGTCVGFRSPQFSSPVFIAGYHFHFLSKDNKTGGHLLDCQLDNGQADIEYCRNVTMTLPEGSKFDTIEIIPEKSLDLKK